MRYRVYALAAVLAVSIAAWATPRAAQQPATKSAPAPAKVAPAAQATTPKPAQTAAAKPAAPSVQMVGGKPLPPVQYVCVMPGDEGVLEDKPGKCPNPKCGMELHPVRLTEAYSSITHPTQFVRMGPGKDRIDGSALVPITASMFWICPGSDDHLIDPGKCGDGSARQLKLERRPHGDHNPRHGGQFFMADDTWHHLEGTYPRGGPFRVFFYDDFTRPMAVKGFSATVVPLDKDDKEIGTPTALKPGRATNALEAPIRSATSLSKEAPFRVAFRVQFTATDKSRLFNFTFPEFTVEPVAPVVTTSAAPSPAAPPKPVPPLAAPAAAVQGAAPNVAASSLTMSRAEATQIAAELPNNTAELLKLLDLRSQEVKNLVQDGTFGMVYVPTMMAKDVALALGDHGNELPDDRRGALGSAVRRLVLASWRLDQYGDLGNREKITDAHGVFAAAVADIKAAYAQSR